MRTCHFCKFPIADDERAIEATTKNAWAHFKCWYEGGPFGERDPVTGKLKEVRHGGTVAK
jgi:hypothetical protein